MGCGDPGTHEAGVSKLAASLLYIGPGQPELCNKTLFQENQPKKTNPKPKQKKKNPLWPNSAQEVSVEEELGR